MPPVDRHLFYLHQQEVYKKRFYGNLASVKYLLILTLIALVCAPLGGTHLHFSVETGFSGVHAVHLHDSGKHAGEADGSIAEILSTIGKLLVACLALTLLLIMCFPRVATELAPRYVEYYPDNPLGALPRLRAPPQLR